MAQLQFYEATRILFVRKENRNNIIYSTILLPKVLSSAILESTTMYVRAFPWMWTTLIMLITFWGKRAHAPWYSPKWRKLLFFVFFAHKECSRSFAKLKLSHWCHTYCFIDVLTFQFRCCLCRLRFHQKYLNLCSEEKRRTYGFETTWEGVINDRIFILGWTNTLK